MFPISCTPKYAYLQELALKLRFQVAMDTGKGHQGFRPPFMYEGSTHEHDEQQKSAHIPQRWQRDPKGNKKRLQAAEPLDDFEHSGHPRDSKQLLGPELSLN
jgi:hypothetical protein